MPSFVLENSFSARRSATLRDRSVATQAQQFVKDEILDPKDLPVHIDIEIEELEVKCRVHEKEATRQAGCSALNSDQLRAVGDSSHLHYCGCDTLGHKTLLSGRNDEATTRNATQLAQPCRARGEGREASHSCRTGSRGRKSAYFSACELLKLEECPPLVRR